CQLEIYDGGAERLDLLPLEQTLALDHDQHVVLAGGKAAVNLLVAAELLRVGAKQLRQRVVHLEACEAEGGHHRRQKHDEEGQARPAEAEEAGALQAERKRASRRVRSGVHKSSPR